jgi:hypothetical protein
MSLIDIDYEEYTDSQKEMIDEQYEKATNPSFRDMKINPIEEEQKVPLPWPNIALQDPTPRDKVNNPPHYKVIDDIEAIDIIRELLGPEGFIAYCYGNVLKYTLRAKKKQHFMTDLNKAVKYVKFIAGE